MYVVVYVYLRICDIVFGLCLLPNNLFFCASVVLGFADDDILLNHRTFTSIKYMNNFHSESVQLKYDE